MHCTVACIAVAHSDTMYPGARRPRAHSHVHSSEHVGAAAYHSHCGDQCSNTATTGQKLPWAYVRQRDTRIDTLHALPATTCNTMVPMHNSLAMSTQSCQCILLHAATKNGATKGGPSTPSSLQGLMHRKIKPSAQTSHCTARGVGPCPKVRASGP